MIGRRRDTDDIFDERGEAVPAEAPDVGQPMGADDAEPAVHEPAIDVSDVSRPTTAASADRGADDEPLPARRQQRRAAGPGDGADRTRPVQRILANGAASGRARLAAVVAVVVAVGFVAAVGLSGGGSPSSVATHTADAQPVRTVTVRVPAPPTRSAAVPATPRRPHPARAPSERPAQTPTRGMSGPATPAPAPAPAPVRQPSGDASGAPASATYDFWIER